MITRSQPSCACAHRPDALRTEDLDLPLRLLDAFVITSKKDPSHICAPDAMANQPIRVEGTVSGDATTGVTHHVALTDILDWCIHYGGDKPSVWLITQYAWWAVQKT